MKNYLSVILILLLNLFPNEIFSSELSDSVKTNPEIKTDGAYYTNVYPNLLKNF